MGDHHVRERAVVHVVSGRVSIGVGGTPLECGAGSLVAFEPGESHSVEALEDARLLLILAPWPAAEHYTDDEASDAQHLPANAQLDPTDSTGRS
jgi:quercetin dioxygenase-like cupin family protein